MKIIKIDHCCLVVEIGGATVLTDPGIFSGEQDSLKNIDAVLITHEHADHYHADSVKAIAKNNPYARIITNSAVGKKLDEIGVKHEVVEGRSKTKVKNVAIEAFDCKHEEIYEEWGQVQNTGYFIGGKLFFPGDAFFDPGEPVEVLALPVAGPWCKIGDAIRYGLRVNPQRAFPVHDGMFGRGNSRGGFIYQVAAQVFREKSIGFTLMKAGDSAEF